MVSKLAQISPHSFQLQRKMQRRFVELASGEGNNGSRISGKLLTTYRALREPPHRVYWPDST